MIKFIIFLLFFIVFPKNAFAYLDPGTGSYIFQIFVASLLAGGYFFKDKVGSVFRSFKNIFKKFSPKRNAKK